MTPDVKALLTKYQAIAPKEGLDPLGYSFPPFGYAAGQVLADAVTGTDSLDQDKIADYIHSHTFHTVMGDITFGKDGEWAKSRSFFTQFQHVTSGDLDQFRDTTHEAIVWPDKYKTADMIFPYATAKKP